jgi:hypothetical protein
MRPAENQHLVGAGTSLWDHSLIISKMGDRSSPDYSFLLEPDGVLHRAHLRSHDVALMSSTISAEIRPPRRAAAINTRQLLQVSNL